MIKKYKLMVIFSLILFVVRTKASEYTDEENRNKETVVRLFQSINQNGKYTPEIIEEFYSPDCLIQRNNETCTYDEAIKAVTGSKKCERIDLVIQVIMAKGNKVGVWYSAYNKFKQETLDGAEIDAPVGSNYEFDSEGIIIRTHEYGTFTGDIVSDTKEQNYLFNKYQVMTNDD